MRKIAFFCVVAIILSGCWPMSKGRIMRTYDCYDGKNTGIESLLDINGYYVLPCWGLADYKAKILFYKNGIFVYGLDPYAWRIRIDGERDIPVFIKEILENPDSQSAEYWKAPTIGRYTVNGDIIKLQFVGLIGAYSWSDAVFEYSFKIADRQTMQFIDVYVKKAGKNARQYYSDRMKQYQDSIAYFVPLDTTPSINHHPMLKDKRFRCK